MGDVLHFADGAERILSTSAGVVPKRVAMDRVMGRKEARSGARPRAPWLFLAILIFACRSVPPPSPPPVAIALNTGLPPINVRYGMPVEDVELGILLAIASPSSPPALPPGEAISDALLPTVLAGATSPRGPDRPWYFAGRSPGLVFAGYERDDITMRVAIRYDDEMVLLRIVESQNLGQTEDSIYEDAFTLLGDLDERIRRSVITVAQRNRYGQPIPANR